MAIKSSRGVTSGKGTPQRLEGQNGDITIRSSLSGKKLFIKDANRWHFLNLDINTLGLNQKIHFLEEELRKIRNSTRNRPVLDAAILRKPGAANIQLKNSSGALQIRNAADNGDVVLATTYTAAKCTDPLADETTVALRTLAGTADHTGVNMNTDILFISDADDGSNAKRTLIKNIVSGLAGDGLTHNAGVLASTVDDTTIELSASDGSGALRAKTAAISDGGTGLATADQIHTFVTSQGYGAGTVTISNQTANHVVTSTGADAIVDREAYHYMTDDYYLFLYDATNYFSIARPGSNGETTIGTVDAGGGVEGHLTLDIDGDIELNADGGDITFKDDSAALALINSDGLRIYNTGSSHATLNATNSAGDFTLATTGVIVSTTVTNEFTLKNGTGGADQYALFGNGSEGIRISSKGTQDIRIETNSGTDSGFISIVDGEDGLITIQPDGEGILLLGATAGAVQFATNNFLDANGNSLFSTATASSAVNDVELGNAATGDSPTIKATGTDTDVDLTLQPKGKGKIFIDKNVSGDAADTGSGLHIDYDRTVASSGTANHSDTGIDVDVNSASLGTGYFRGIDIDVAGTSAGSSTTIGADITVTGADSNIGLLINTPDTHIHMQASADAANDYGTIAVADTGDMTIATTGNGTKDSDITLDADGSIILDASSGNFVAKRNGTEFSATNSAYAGMILGYTRLEGDLSNQDTFEIQNSLTVEDDEHKITFITPPSQYVEIEATFLINAVSSDTRIFVGLSSANATDGYSAVSAELEYDGTGIVFTDDEIDDHVKTVKWVLKSSHLAGVGSSNTFWIGFSTANATKTAYLGYGYRATHGITDHPFIIKATALPAAIHDGQ